MCRRDGPQIKLDNLNQTKVNGIIRNLLTIFASASGYY